MKAYLVDGVGKFVCEVERQIDPLESERAGYPVWLVPGGCVTVEPPEHVEGFDRVWTGLEWVRVEIQKPPVEEVQPTSENTQTPVEVEMPEEVRLSRWERAKAALKFWA